MFNTFFLCLSVCVFPLGSLVFSYLPKTYGTDGRWTGDTKLLLGMKMCVYGALQWTAIPYSV